MSFETFEDQKSGSSLNCFLIIVNAVIMFLQKSTINRAYKLSYLGRELPKACSNHSCCQLTFIGCFMWLNMTGVSRTREPAMATPPQG